MVNSNKNVRPDHSVTSMIPNGYMRSCAGRGAKAVESRLRHVCSFIFMYTTSVQQDPGGAPWGFPFDTHTTLTRTLAMPFYL